MACLSPIDIIFSNSNWTSDTQVKVIPQPSYVCSRYLSTFQYIHNLAAQAFLYRHKKTLKWAGGHCRSYLSYIIRKFHWPCTNRRYVLFTLKNTQHKHLTFVQHAHIPQGEQSLNISSMLSRDFQKRRADNLILIKNERFWVAWRKQRGRSVGREMLNWFDCWNRLHPCTHILKTRNQVQSGMCHTGRSH